MSDLTLDERTAISHAFDRGNYAYAYESNDLESFGLDEMKTHNRVAFVLGFLNSLALSEMEGYEREIFDECYFSEVGQYIVKVAGYTDDRAEEYAECEAEEYAECES